MVQVRSPVAFRLCSRLAGESREVATERSLAEKKERVSPLLIKGML